MNIDPTRTSTTNPPAGPPSTTEPPTDAATVAPIEHPRVNLSTLFTMDAVTDVSADRNLLQFGNTKCLSTIQPDQTIQTSFTIELWAGINPVYVVLVGNHAASFYNPIHTLVYMSQTEYCGTDSSPTWLPVLQQCGVTLVAGGRPVYRCSRSVFGVSSMKITVLVTAVPWALEDMELCGVTFLSNAPPPDTNNSSWIWYEKSTIRI